MKTDDEIALELVLSSINKIHPTVYSSNTPNEQNEKYNLAMANQIAIFYNTIYNSIKQNKQSKTNKSDNFDNSSDSITVI